MPLLKPLWYSLWYYPYSKLEKLKLMPPIIFLFSERQRSQCQSSFYSCRPESKVLARTISLERENEENHNKLLTND